MIREVLVTGVKAAFPGAAIKLGTPPDPIVVIPAKHAEVGDVSIHDEGEEVALHIGDITHGHFSSPDPSLPERESAARITSAVIEFLQDLFADRVVVWQGPGGVAGGWLVLTQGKSMKASQLPGVKRYLWSGPIR